MKKIFSIIAMAMLTLAVATSCDDEDIYPAQLFISGVGIENGEVDLMAQDTVQINLSFFPKHAIKDNITYTSSNENVATVSETGLVRGIDTGTAIITVKCPMMPVRYCWLEHDYATATLKVHVTGSTLQLGEGEVSQGEADSRQQAW
jgi:hypothetical protein